MHDIGAWQLCGNFFTAYLGNPNILILLILLLLGGGTSRRFMVIAKNLNLGLSKR